MTNNNKNTLQLHGTLQNPFRIIAIIVILLCVQFSNAQIIGATFGIHSCSSGATIIQSIGQPFAVFEKMEESGKRKNSVHMNQGHILPMGNFSEISEKLTLKAYPNPVSDILNVSVDNASIIRDIMVMDMNGRVVQNSTSVNVNQAEINMKELAAGIYLINVTDDNGNRGFAKITKIGQRIN